MQSRAFTKLFASITYSSIWSEDDATRIIWITMLAMADGHGYVGASIPGLAARSRKSVAEVEAALAKFHAPDPYSRTTSNEGRRVETVEGGWRLLNYERHRSVALTESAKESKRLYAARARATAKTVNESELSRIASNDVEPSRSQSNAVDAESNLPSVSVSDSGSGSGKGVQGETIAAPVEAQGQRLVYRDLDGWEPPPDLVAQALELMTREQFEARVADLRLGPIGGRRGTYDRTDYVRRLLPTWRAWNEVDKAKADSRAAKGAPKRFGGGVATEQAPPERKRVPGAPPWVYEQHAALARERGLDLKRSAREFALTYHLPVNGMRPCDLFEPFRKFLEGVAC